MLRNIQEADLAVCERLFACDNWQPFTVTESAADPIILLGLRQLAAGSLRQHLPSTHHSVCMAQLTARA